MRLATVRASRAASGMTSRGRGSKAPGDGRQVQDPCMHSSTRRPEPLPEARRARRAGSSTCRRRCREAGDLGVRVAFDVVQHQHVTVAVRSAARSLVEIEARQRRRGHAAIGIERSISLLCRRPAPRDSGSRSDQPCPQGRVATSPPSRGTARTQASCTASSASLGLPARGAVAPRRTWPVCAGWYSSRKAASSPEPHALDKAGSGGSDKWVFGSAGARPRRAPVPGPGAGSASTSARAAPVPVPGAVPVPVPVPVLCAVPVMPGARRGNAAPVCGTTALTNDEGDGGSKGIAPRAGRAADQLRRSQRRPSAAPGIFRELGSSPGADAGGLFEIVLRLRAIAERVVDHARVIEDVRVARAELHRLADGGLRFVEALVPIERPRQHVVAA